MADDKKLQDLAKNNPNEFEKYYKLNVDSRADGATIAAKQSYYKNLDLSSTNPTLPKQNIFNQGVDAIRTGIDTQKTQSSQYAEGEMFRISNMLDIINKTSVDDMKEILKTALEDIKHLNNGNINQQYIKFINLLW